MSQQFLNAIQLMRPKHYIKNLFIFAPLFFSGKLLNTDLFLNAAWGFFAFCLSASAIYILNDYLDIEEDKKHPTKKLRPLASGAISKTTALILMLILITSGLSLMFFLSLDGLKLLAFYVLMNIAYSIRLKHISILDINIIAVGFVLRLFIGSVLTNTPLSLWIVVMTFLLALFLALAKRRDDVLLFNQSGQKMRKAVKGYNLRFIDGAMVIMSSVVVVCYIMFTISPEVVARMHSDYLYITAVFVILGIMRYLQITHVEENSGSPTKILLTDTFIQLTVIAWILAFVWVLYL